MFEPVVAISDYKGKSQRSSDKIYYHNGTCLLSPDFLFNETKKGMSEGRRQKWKKDGEREERENGKNLHKA